MPRDGCYARFRLVTLVEEEVHFAVAPAPVRVGQSRERGVQFHIGLRQRRKHARRDVARSFDQRGEAKVGRVFGIHERLVHHQAWCLPHENHLAACLGEGSKTFQPGPRDHRRGWHHDSLVNLTAEILEAAVLDGRHRTERLLVEIIPIHLVLEQLPAELGSAAIGLLVAHPYAVAGMVQSPPARPAVRWPSSSRRGWHTMPASKPAVEPPAGGAVGSPPLPRITGTSDLQRVTPRTS